LDRELQQKIYEEIKEEWIKRYGEDKIDLNKLSNLKLLLKLVPDKDGFKRVTKMESGKTYLVPIKDMILNGLHGKDLKKYQEVKDE